ncbi:MAG: transposase [Maribacter sp.]
MSWKREFLDNAALAFGPKPKKEDANSETEPRYNKIDQLQVVTDFLKKVLGK